MSNTSNGHLISVRVHNTLLGVFLSVSPLWLFTLYSLRSVDYWFALHSDSGAPIFPAAATRISRYLVVIYSDFCSFVFEIIGVEVGFDIIRRRRWQPRHVIGERK